MSYFEWNSDFMRDALAPLGYDYSNSTSAVIGNPTWFIRTNNRNFLKYLTSIEEKS